MSLGWIDFSKNERNKVLNVIHMLDEPGTVDELGIGVVRDAFADYFFPGTSTVQTRAKYFLIVPYILMEAGSGKYGFELNTILKNINDEEKNCRDILIKTSSDGVIGSLVPNSWVLRTPSNIYWNGIKRMGIFKANLTVKEYVHQSIIQKKMKLTKAYGNRDKNAEENEKDDMDAGDITLIHFWNLGDTYRNDWRDNLTIELLPSEASFLRNQIITVQRNSLFAFILKNNIDLSKYDSFGALSEDIREYVDEDLQYMMGLANDFNDLVSLITTRYNMIIFEGKNDKACRNWEMYAKDLKRRSEVNIREILKIFNKKLIRNPKLVQFLLDVQEAVRDGDIATVDELVKTREIRLKGPKRAKVNRVGEFSKQGWVGIDILDYRYTPAKRIIRDIMNAEVV